MAEDVQKVSKPPGSIRPSAFRGSSPYRTPPHRRLRAVGRRGPSIWEALARACEALMVPALPRAYVRQAGAEVIGECDACAGGAHGACSSSCECQCTYEYTPGAGRRKRGSRGQ